MAVVKARHRRRMKLSFFSGLRLIGAMGTVLAIAGLALQWLVPAEWVEWTTESLLSDYLERPVELDDAALRMFPLPRVQADTLRIGGGSPLPFEAEDANLYLDPIGVIQGQPFRHMEFQSAVAAPAALLDGLAGLGETSPERLATVEVKSLRFDGVEMDDGDPLALKITGQNAGEWRLGFIRGAEELWFRVRRAGKGFVFDAQAADWTLDGRPDLPLRGVSASGHLSDRRLEVERFSAFVGNGKLKGSLALPFHEVWRIEGSVTLDKIPAGSVLDWAGHPLLRGPADGTLYLSGVGEDLGDLFDALGLSGSVSIGGGSVSNMDLAEALRRGGELSGGETMFEQLELKLDRGAGNWSATVEILQSPSIRARGELQVRFDGRMEGQLEVMPSNGSAEPVPVRVAGSSRKPMLYPPQGPSLIDFLPLPGRDAEPDAGKDETEDVPPPSEPAESVEPKKDDTPWILDYE